MSKQTSTFSEKGPPSIRNHMDLILVTVNQFWSCRHTSQSFQQIFMSHSDLVTDAGDCQMVHTSHVVNVSNPSAPNRSSNVATQPLGHKNSSLQCRRPYFLWKVGHFFSEMGQQNWWVVDEGISFKTKVMEEENQFDRAFKKNS